MKRTILMTLLLLSVSAGIQAQFNQLPVLSPIGNQSVNEGDNLSFTISATDAESTPDLLATGLHYGMSFTDSGNGTGFFNWTPCFLCSGAHQIIFKAVDDSGSVDSEIVTITVNEIGNPPQILS